MKIDDVMTTQEAGERWGIGADAIKHVCLKHYARKRFKEDECKKSGKNWLVTVAGMTRLYGQEPKTTK